MIDFIIDKALEEQERIVGKLVLMLPEKDLRKINKMIQKVLKEKKENAKVQEENNQSHGL